MVSDIHRYLAIHHVDYRLSDYRNHQPGDVGCYDHESAVVDDASIPELLVILERMQRAVDRPAIIAAEHPNTTTHTFASDDDVLCVSARPADRAYSLSARVEVQFEEHLVHSFSLKRARELLEQLQAAVSSLGRGDEMQQHGTSGEEHC